MVPFGTRPMNQPVINPELDLGVQNRGELQALTGTGTCLSSRS